MSTPTSYRIRPVRREDAAAYLEIRRQLDRESAFMMLEPDERQTTLSEELATLDRVLATPNQMMFVAEVAEGRLAGHLQAFGGRFRRNARTIELVVGVLAAYAGRGIASALFTAAEAWARSIGAHRLELSVMTHNARAIALYRRLGFQIEGTAREELFVGGRYVDEYRMAKILP